MKSSTIKCILVACTFLLLTACSKSSSSYGGNTPPPSGSTSNKVSIVNMSFSPSQTTVKKGTTITWTNNDYMTHTVTADANSFNSSNLNNGTTFSFTFNTTGTFNYHCSIHPGMTGSVIVK